MNEEIITDQEHLYWKERLQASLEYQKKLKESLMFEEAIQEMVETKLKEYEE